MIQSAKELVETCLHVINNYQTIYVMGCFGAPMTESNKQRYINGYAFNRRVDRAEKIAAATDETFGFDCVCFIKGLFWGWNGDADHVYGGAAYKSNNVADISTEQMLAVCTDVSEDFSTIVPGEYVWLPGHCGIYVGNGMAAEATFEPADGVQLQCVLPMGVTPGMPATAWIKHGKLPWIRYDEEAAYRVTLEGVNRNSREELESRAKEENWQFHAEKMESMAPEEKPWEPKEGDLVQFLGGTQYGNSGATEGTLAAAGEARVHKIASGKAHPYSLVRTGKAGPYGWVDRDTFIKA